MKIRLMGTSDELNAAIPLLGEVFEVLEVNGPYANRGASKLGRVYVEVAAPAPAGPVQAHAVRADRAEITSKHRQLKR
ncbi:hypothetical protein [Lentzea cavernae]|uniref:Uncharacterized protein n=1 Tax=Lentzea cavernae TaxID=2020703 RepID=A0ABQ3MSA3_9PSEU|nr:hypothetical protein [Lentzea cavernae]GHH57620.1 hypothetical protein GCM10017774_77440 [Lentzea cavernae]